MGQIWRLPCFFCSATYDAAQKSNCGFLSLLSGYQQKYPLQVFLLLFQITVSSILLILSFIQQFLFVLRAQQQGQLTKFPCSLNKCEKSVKFRKKNSDYNWIKICHFYQVKNTYKSLCMRRSKGQLKPILILNCYFSCVSFLSCQENKWMSKGATNRET